MKHVPVLILVCCSLSACALRMEARPDGPPPPPPPAPQMMSYEEAVQSGSAYARDRGYGYRLREAHLDNGNLWKLNFQIFEHERPGRLHLEYDAFSRQLLAADARVSRRHGEHQNDDGDDNDGEHEHHRRENHERDD